MKEIPIPLVRANQAGIVLFVVAAVLLKAPVLIAALWAVQVLGLWRGIRANVFVQLAAPFLKNRIVGAQTEARELLRFNNSIAVSLLTLSLIGFWLDRDGLTGYVLAGLVALAALIAILGFCVGCFLYYQWKRLTR
ncbi:DUF4395 domain-containing protein [Paenibacillus filicis]|uniref:DUF4395 domain-containing protein n=1 Tax=Paenibacillus filicis TaxID=669464 RepID=A0ABU9DHX2_9BACL